MSFKTDGRAGLGESKGGTHMLIIDPQIDFHSGSLAVVGANDDARRYSHLLLDHIERISKVHVTLDTHHKQHIAHGVFWKDTKGNHPAPFTMIPTKDIESKKWTTTRPELNAHALEYSKGLDAGGRFQLIIWPEHCIIGTPGHNVVPILQHAVTHWSNAHNEMVNYVFKGQNPLTEMYSALRADYIIESDPGTKLNKELIDALFQADRVLVCGEAKSHCVNFTIRDLLHHWPADRKKDLWLLEDGMSSVKGFEETGDKFIEDMRAEGLTICTCEKAFA